MGLSCDVPQQARQTATVMPLHTHTYCQVARLSTAQLNKWTMHCFQWFAETDFTTVSLDTNDTVNKPGDKKRLALQNVHKRRRKQDVTSFERKMLTRLFKLRLFQAFISSNFSSRPTLFCKDDIWRSHYLSSHPGPAAQPWLLPLQKLSVSKGLRFCLF